MKILQLSTNPLVGNPSYHFKYTLTNSLTSINPCIIPRGRFYVPPLYAAAPSRPPRDPKVNQPGAGNNKEKKLELEGVITESLPNGMFYVRLENDEVVLGYISGRIRKNYIRILPGDKVKLETAFHPSSVQCTPKTHRFKPSSIFSIQTNNKQKKKNQNFNKNPMKTLQLYPNPLIAPRPNPFTHPKNTIFINNTCLIPRHPFRVPPISANSRQSKDPIMVSTNLKEKKMELEGEITESLPNGMFHVRLVNNEVVLGYISGKIRKNFIKILPGDKVLMEVSLYDSTRGRIIFRQDDSKKSGKKDNKKDKRDKKKDRRDKKKKDKKIEEQTPERKENDSGEEQRS
ncbi:hypothetical protein ACFE04_028197 [Oxalis oulophora]